MLPANANIVYCPYCGKTKELLSLMSGNTFGAKYWSDYKMRAPMLPIVSPVQKCSHCGKYYLVKKQKKSVGDHPTFELGELLYPEWKEAYFQLLNEMEECDEHKRFTKSDMFEVCLGVIQAYNDYYYRDNKAEFSQNEYCFIQGVIKVFIDAVEWSDNEGHLLKAELYREANMMKECADTLSIVDYNLLDENNQIWYDGIRVRMKNGISIVFQL